MPNIPQELWLLVFSFLATDQEFSRCALVCKSFQLAAEHEFLWKIRVRRLFQGKQLSSALAKLPPVKSTYVFALKDRTRQMITLDELCEILWHMRFLDTTSSLWKSKNPQDGSGLLRRFCSNGKYWFPPDDPVYCDPEIVASIGTDLVWSSASFLENMYVRLTFRRNDGFDDFLLQNFPSMRVVRNPHNWGWEISGPHSHYVSNGLWAQ